MFAEIPVRTVVATIVLTLQTLSAAAHSWYPRECCHEIDCAPVDQVVKMLPAGGGQPQLLVTSKFGTAIIPHEFPVRESMDGRMHICMGYDPFGRADVLCFFMPPST